MRRKDRGGTLQRELEDRIKNGRCVYCRATAAPDRPLTREHVIPRARGGGRKDSRIIVPACAPCNQRRGSQEVVVFLLARPRRIVAFLEYLSTLPAETLREVDLRVFAELYAAVWLLGDSAADGEPWRERLRHLCSGRRLHKRRYAARRIVHAVGTRLERTRDRAADAEGPSCLLPGTLAAGGRAWTDETMVRAVATLVGALSLVWEVSAERVLEELERERVKAVSRRRAAAAGAVRIDAAALSEDDDETEAEALSTTSDEADGVLSLDGWRRRRNRRRRVRVDQRGGRGASRKGRTRGRAA